jgi:O-antigen ligase
MKKLFIINDSLPNKTSYYILAAFCIALPFDRFFSEWLLILFCCHTAMHLERPDFKKWKDPNLWMAASVFLLSVSAITYSSYKWDGLQDSLRQVAIGLFPVFLFSTHIDMAKYKWKLLEIFALTCTVTILYCYFEMARIILYFHLSPAAIVSKSFLNQQFTAPVGTHATYLSMYVLLSLCIFLFLFFRSGNGQSWYHLLCACILLAGLLQLSSRSAFIAALAILIFIIPFYISKPGYRFIYFGVALTLSLVIVLAITKVPNLKTRYIDDLENDLSQYRDPGDLTESRMSRWNLAWQLVKKAPLLGYGTGAESFILKNTYFENKFYRSYLLGLNAHSQFLSFLLNTGLVGLLVYLVLLGYAGRLAIKRKDFLFLSFLMIIFFVSLSENILTVSKGVLFYAFFLSLFLMPVSAKKGNISIPGSRGNPL